MVVYADILMLVNFIVDYFLLMLTSAILKRKIPLWRTLCGAAVGAVSALYIFLPQSAAIIEIIIRLLISAVITLIAFGYKTIKSFLRANLCFFAASFLYAGAMMAIWAIFKPNGLIINNSVVYLDISPIFLIAFSVMGYFISALFGFLLRKRATAAAHCSVGLTVGDNTLTLDAIIDSGNSLTDAFGLSEVIVTEQAAAHALLGEDLKNDFCRSRYRAIPCGTVSSADILDGYRIDSATIKTGQKTVKISKPIIALSKTMLAECGAIVNPRSVE